MMILVRHYILFDPVFSIIPFISLNSLSNFPLKITIFFSSNASNSSTSVHPVMMMIMHRRIPRFRGRKGPNEKIAYQQQEKATNKHQSCGFRTGVCSDAISIIIGMTCYRFFPTRRCVRFFLPKNNYSPRQLLPCSHVSLPIINAI